MIALLVTPLESAQAGTTCGTGWHVIRSPSTAARINELNGVVAVAVDDVWAVGSAGASPLIEHWDGTAWSIARSPSIKGQLSDVDAASADDVWAVGSSRGYALIEHWDGTSWTVASRSIPGSLAGVSALRSGFALAVGTQRGPHEHRPLALRFDGSSWEQVPTSNRGDPDPEALSAVVATSRHEAWGVGAADLGFDGITANLAERWNGVRFSRFPIPTPGEGMDRLSDVDAIAPDDVWAVGSSRQPSFETNGMTVTEHWNGRSWRQVPSPNPEIPSRRKLREPPLGRLGRELG